MLLSVEGMEEVHGIGFNTIYVTAHNHKQKTGEFPNWYIMGDDNFLIDDKLFFRHEEIHHQSWMHCTDYLYWGLLEAGFSDTTLAEKMIEKSRAYKSKNGWINFFSTSMFRPNTKTIVSPQYSMKIDFLVIGTELLYRIIKNKKGNT